MGKSQIIIDLRSLSPGKWSGVENYTYNLVKNLLEISPYETFLFWNSSSSESKKVISQYFPKYKKKFLFTRIPNKFFSFTTGVFRSPKVDEFLKDKFSKIKNPRLFFCPDPRPTPLSKNCKKIITFHDLSLEIFPEHFSKKTRIWKNILFPRREAREAEAIISPSSFTKSELRNIYGISPKKIHTIPHGFPLRHSKKDYSKENYILTIGCANQRKNTLTLIKAFEILQEKFPNLELKIIGEKNSHIFEKQNLQNQKNITFLGFVSEEKKWELLKKAKVFVFPSLYEGFGIPILESIAAKTKMALSDIAPFQELAGGLAEYFNPSSPEDMAEVIDTVLTSAQKDFSQKKFISWRKCAQRTLDVFEKVIG